MLRRLIVVAVVSALAVGCGGPESPEESTGPPTVVFGTGTMPASVPEGFPIPPGASIGTTMEDRASGSTEVVMVVSADPEAVVGFYEGALPEAGFEVSDSGGGDHVIEFSGRGIDGELVIAVGSPSTATVALTLRAP